MGNIVAKKEIAIDGELYVIVKFENGTYAIYTQQEFRNEFPGLDSGDYNVGSMDNTHIRKMTDSISSPQENKLGFFDKLFGTFKALWYLLIIAAILMLFFQQK